MAKVKSELYLTVGLKIDEQQIIQVLKTDLINVIIISIELLDKDVFKKNYKVVFEHDIVFDVENYLIKYL